MDDLFGANSRDAFGPDNSRYWYPRAWVAPNGKVFGISSDKMWFVDPTGNGSVSIMAFRNAPQAANTALNAPNSGPASTAVMYDTGKILQVGGNSFHQRRRLPVVEPGDRRRYQRNNPRSHRRGADEFRPCLGELPQSCQRPSRRDGRQQVQRSSTGPTRSRRRRSGRRPLANGASAPAASIYRGYHSTAILMQNGTLLSAGGGAPGPFSNQNAEIYYPPYLFTSVNGQVGLAPRPRS